MLFIFPVRSRNCETALETDGRRFLELMPFSRCIGSAPAWRAVL
jgi:hypothetical protein